MEHESDGDTKCNWCTWNDPQRPGKEAGRVGNRRTSRDHPNYNIVKIDQNTEKNPGDFTVTQTLVKDHHSWHWCEKLTRSYMIIMIILSYQLLIY